MTEAREKPPREARRCHDCGRELRAPEDVRWECDCGVAVCSDDECFEEYFKILADGESTRCRSCGLVV